VTFASARFTYVNVSPNPPTRGREEGGTETMRASLLHAQARTGWKAPGTLLVLSGKLNTSVPRAGASNPAL
jgi:hypothetical protein